MAQEEKSEKFFLLHNPPILFGSHLHDSHDEVDEVGHPSELFKGVEHPEGEESVL